MVSVEIHLADALPVLTIVGPPEKAAWQYRGRVRGALLDCGFELSARRITAGTAPAYLPEQGSRLDPAIALGIPIASGQLPADAGQRDQTHSRVVYAAHSENVDRRGLGIRL